MERAYNVFFTRHPKVLLLLYYARTAVPMCTVIPAASVTRKVRDFIVVDLWMNI